MVWEGATGLPRSRAPLCTPPGNLPSERLRRDRGGRRRWHPPKAPRIPSTSGPAQSLYATAGGCSHQLLGNTTRDCPGNLTMAALGQSPLVLSMSTLETKPVWPGWNFNTAVAHSRPRFVTVCISKVRPFLAGFPVEHLRHADPLRQGRQVCEKQGWMRIDLGVAYGRRRCLRSEAGLTLISRGSPHFKPAPGQARKGAPDLLEPDGWAVPRA